MNATREHRQAGRGRRAFWVAMTLGALIGIMWWAPGRAQSGNDHSLEWRRGQPRMHSVTTLGTEFAAHLGMLRRAGLTSSQIERVAGELNAHGTAFANLEADREALEGRLAAMLSVEALDFAELSGAREQAQALTERAVDEVFDLLEVVARELTADQRADLARHWINR